MTTAFPSPAPSPLLVVCLCAQWCVVCREYQPVLQAVLDGFDATQLRLVWLDIEDQSELVGDLDVDNFPTLLIAQDNIPVFFGTLAPHGATLMRLLRSALAGDLKPVAAGGDVTALVGRLSPGTAEKT